MQYFRFTARVTLAGKDKPRTFNRGFGYFKPALKWVREWTDRSTFRFGEIVDVDRQSPAWNSRDGLLLNYRTVKPEDAPGIFPFSIQRKPNYGSGSGSATIGMMTRSRRAS